MTGTGFLISARGHIVTSAHVVSECADISVRLAGHPAVSAELITTRPDLDLALLKSALSSNSVAKLRLGNPIEAGAEVVVFGYPLSGSLSSGGNVVVGNVTALMGLGDNRQLLQISAPVQLGNSGGPLLDQYGNVIGVIQSKLDAILVAKQLGDIPENVGFAVKDTVLRDFFAWAGTAYETAVSVYALPVTEVRKKAEAFTVAVECQKPD